MREEGVYQDLERQAASTATDCWVEPDSIESVEANALLGQTLAGQYHLLEIIGAGGFGVVFRARQLNVSRDVAIKVLHPHMAHDAVAVQRFENEARIVSQLRHPNTLHLHDSGRTPSGLLFIVTELLTGKPLSEIISSSGRLPLERSAFIIEAVCRSLAEAHAAGIVHRDLKPDNVYIDRVGSDDVVKVLDFGIAKVLEGDARITRPGALSGTPHYMAPELASGGIVDARADIYALGVMFYRMLSGELPFPGESLLEIMRGHLFEPAPSLITKHPNLLVPEEVDTLIRRMLEKSPEQRPETVDEVRGLVSRIAGLPPSQPRFFAAGPVPASRGSLGTPTVTGQMDLAGLDEPIGRPNRERSRVWSWAVAALVILMASGGIAWYLSLGEHLREWRPLGETMRERTSAPIREPSSSARGSKQTDAPERSASPESIRGPELLRSKPRSPKAARTSRPHPPRELGDDVLPVNID